MNMVQSNAVNEFLLLDMYSVGKSHHVFKFELATMADYFNLYGARFSFKCLTKTLDEIDASTHVSIPADLYGKSFLCLATRTFNKCRKIHDRTLTMPNRKSQGQMKTNLNIIHMDPRMWWMLVSQLENQPQLSIPNHTVYYDDNKTTFNTLFGMYNRQCIANEESVASRQEDTDSVLYQGAHYATAINL
jgi:hypothetical protein